MIGRKQLTLDALIRSVREQGLVFTTGPRGALLSRHVSEAARYVGTKMAGGEIGSGT
eukprot:CAMPEP_0179303974 /NCGR_PEP_ID=MMETSP0797-20121207/48853_1 /TAXON_ID=47934 /ORGANISM="Dinophysis acuminata, Strain DAEP01" /LENGTH=56 /DNA_ID=CAMNT_0021013545 /DNA_START=102 /DNA_END=269 /DNA_ORIENTATION=-